MPGRISSITYAAIACIFVVVMAFYVVWSQRPPAALPKDAPADQFSAYRAIEHAFNCSSETHPAGSKNNDKVAAYLMNTLESWGIEAEFMVKPVVEGNKVELQQAVIARIPGTDNTGAIAFSAHYDSVPYGPGATDDIGGCITMLEAARAFANQPRMRNDLLFIFADAEEVGGYGAKGFCSHPLAENIGIISELDVRGTKGPALFYEYSDGNGALIRELREAKEAGVMPVTNSLMYAIYEASPFGSDFTKFRNAGMKGYSLAYIDGFSWYHTANDSPEHISPESIQHFGSFVMGISKHFGNRDFATVELASTDETFFNTVGFNLIQYPMSLVMPLAVFAVLLLLLITGAGMFMSRIRWTGYLMALLLFLPVAFVCMVLGFIAFGIVFGFGNIVTFFVLRPSYIPEIRIFHEGNLYCYAIALLTIAITTFTYGAAGKRLRVVEVYAASLAWLCPILIVMALYFPGGSYLFLWPVIFGAFGVGILEFGDANLERRPWLLFVVLLFGMPALFLLLPGWQQLVWMASILVLPLHALLVIFMLFNFMPAVVLLGRVRRFWWFSCVLAVIAVLMIASGLILQSKPTKDRPIMNSVVYAANLDTGEAAWMSEDEQVDEWTQQFFDEGNRSSIKDLVPGKQGDHYLRSKAPVAASLTGLRCAIESDSIVDGKRIITARLYTEDAPFRVYLKQKGGPKILGVTVNGMEVDTNPDDFRISFNLFEQDGYEMTLATTPGEAVQFEAFLQIYGFPDIPGVTPRPEYMVPESNIARNGISLRSQHIYVTNSVVLPASDTVMMNELRDKCHEALGLFVNSFWCWYFGNSCC